MEIHHEVNSLKLTLKNKTFDRGVTGLHWHEKLELVTALDLPFDLIIEGVRYTVMPGDVVLIGERVIHQFDIKTDGTKVRIGQFPLNILFGTGAEIIGIKPHIKRSELLQDADFAFKVDGILNTISRESRITDEENPFLQMMLAALYFLLMSRFGIREESDIKPKRDFYRILSYVNEHFKESITAGGIAKALYMDRGRLSSLFLKYSGTSLLNYVGSLRITYAEELIHGGSSITSAALESGFGSVRTFNGVYKRLTGKTPSSIKNKSLK